MLLSGAAAACAQPASALSVQVPAFAVPAGAAADLGFSAERLKRLSIFMQQATNSSGHLGGVTLVLRQGRLVDWQAHGHADLARNRPMTRDAIFRIYSMSKTVVTVAALMLMEEGRLSLDDPISRHLPEFGTVKVLAGGTADAPLLRAPRRPITVQHLLTHTAGFATGGEGIEAASGLLNRADPQGAADLKEFATRVASAPLASDPGERFRYDGVQIEVLGRLIERVSGQPLAEVLRQRIFEPLMMIDTAFQVPMAQRHRVVDISTMGTQGRLVLAAGPSAIDPGVPLRRYASGAGGLYSTAADFARFSQMLLGAGTLDGVTLLGRKTVEMMMTNHLSGLAATSTTPAGRFSAAEGFGLGGSVLLDVAQRGRLGSVGSFGWSGAASTYFSIDPKEQLVAILLLQHLPAEGLGGGVADLPKLSAPFYNLVYQALIH